MQHRMKENPMSQKEMEQLLIREEVGRFVTNSKGGYPYAIPVHYVYYNQKIYLHSLPQGKKVDNLSKDKRVCFELDHMSGYIKKSEKAPCSTNTEFESIIILGKGKILEDTCCKEEVLHQFVRKYTPEYQELAIPEKRIKGTGVIEITIEQCTGKYYREA